MPDFQAALKKIRMENPDVADVSVEEAGPIGQFFMKKGTYGTTSPFTGSVSINPAEYQNQTQDELENTIAHELQHSRQVAATPYLNRFWNVARSMVGFDPEGSTYNLRPREAEAFQVEHDRTRNLNLQNVRTDPATGGRDIQLEPDRPVSKRRKILDAQSFYDKYYRK